MAQVAVACNKFKLHCLLPLPTPATMATGSTNGVPSEESLSTEKSQAVTFTVDFEEKPRNPRRIPNNLSSARPRKEKKISEETIAEKQKQAEERRKKLIEERLERIHQMEEEAQKLAQAMAPMLKSNNGVANGESFARKLHKDSDVVGAVTVDEVNLATHISAERLASDNK